MDVATVAAGASLISLLQDLSFPDDIYLNFERVIQQLDFGNFEDEIDHFMAGSSSSSSSQVPSTLLKFGRTICVGLPPSPLHLRMTS